jgi:hypothetical protein
MKRILLLAVFAFIISSVSAKKDINLRIENRVDVDVTLYTGLITSKQNYYSDEDIVQYRSDLNFTASTRPIRAKKKGQAKVKEASNSQILIVFGLYAGGGRTEVFRYKVRDIKEALSVVFPEVPVIKPNSSYYNVAKTLFESGDAGAPLPVGNVQVTGIFVFYDVATMNLADLYVMRPLEPVPFDREHGEDNEAGDFLMKSATPAYYNEKGLVFRAIPEDANEAFNEVIVPAIEKMPSIFGASEYKYLTWNIINSGKVVSKPTKSSYMELINSCRSLDQKMVNERYFRDILSNGKSSFHLYFITSAYRCDSLYILDSEMEPLSETDLLREDDLITPTGNMRFTGKDKTVYQQTFVIKDLIAIDLTPLMQYKTLMEGQFGKSTYAAANIIELYNDLGNYLELPALEDDVLSLRNPDLTIRKVKANVSDPEILRKIEAKLKTDPQGPIPTTISSGLRSKLERGR